MSDAVNSGFLARVNTPSDITGTCSSERCEWDPYWTLAICPVAEDVTSRMTSIDPGVVDGVPITGPRLSNSTYISLSITSPVRYRQTVGTVGSNLTIEERGTISDSLLFWYTPCAPDWTGDHKDRQYWRAYRATMHLCLQRLNSTFHNSSMHTEVMESRIDVPWRSVPLPLSGSSDICGDSPDGTHCIADMYVASHAAKLYDTFNGNASTAPGGDNYYEPTRMRTFVIDLLGANPTACTNNEAQGFGTFERRMQNIASAMSNT